MKNKTKLTWKIFLQHAWKYKFPLLSLLFFIISASSVGLIIPFYYKKFFDTLTVQGQSSVLVSQLFHILLAIGALQLLQWALWRASAFINNYFQPKVMADIANTCFAYLHKHSFNFFNNNFAGSLVKRLTRFYRAFEGISDKIAWQIGPLVINVVVILFVLFRKNTTLGEIMAVWLVVFMIANWFLTNFKMKYELQKSEAETKVTGILADTITNHANVKLFNGYGRERKYFGGAIEKMRRLRKLTWDLDTVFDGIQGLLTIGLEIGILYYAIVLWRQNILSVGDFVLLQTYLLQIINHIWDFGRMVRSMYTDLAEAEEMTEILDTPHEIQDPIKAKKMNVVEGKIEFKDVDFHYHQTRPILRDFSLVIEPKEKIAFVGHSGAGKTTVIKLLLRMHDVTRGKIYIDGQKVSCVTQESLWKYISLVPQEPILFHRTLMENIRYGKPDATDEEVIEASKRAHCHEFISQLPDKYETYVGERGVKLSGGERQRVAIARAILADTPILVLDEATSSLDSESERFIQEALDALMKNKTVIVIAHRLSTIMKMDRIVVMDQGKIVEAGSHTQLLKKKTGMYRQLWDLQVGGFID